MQRNRNSVDWDSALLALSDIEMHLINPMAPREPKIVYNFVLSECSRVNYIYTAYKPKCFTNVSKKYC